MTILTERLRLRPLCYSDLTDLHELYSNPENEKFLFPAHLKKSETEAFLVNHFLANPLGKWGIELLDAHKIIGTIAVVKSDELSYLLHSDYQNHGYMTETVSNLTKTFPTVKFVIRCEITNFSSKKVAVKAGFHLVKQEKSRHPYKQKIVIFEEYRLD